ncbi:hypothetical protein HYV73_04770 [Candidatus Uhrbacteria bacterium]|nr:hypothetical protein [Candidatus Uhrbacteria bacterium]
MLLLRGAMQKLNRFKSDKATIPPAAIEALPIIIMAMMDCPEAPDWLTEPDVKILKTYQWSRPGNKDYDVEAEIGFVRDQKRTSVVVMVTFTNKPYTVLTCEIYPTPGDDP